MMLHLLRCRRLSTPSSYTHCFPYKQLRCASTSNPTSAVLSSLRRQQTYRNGGDFQLDRGQQRATRYLDRLQETLINYSNAEIWEHRIEASKRRKQEEHERMKPSEGASSAAGASSSAAMQSPAVMAEQTQSIKTHTSQILQNSSSDNMNSNLPTAPPSPYTALPPPPKIPRGLYIYGPVGTGKTMLMHAFYESIHTATQKWHFHAFMNHIHEQIHAVKLQNQLLRKPPLLQQQMDEDADDDNNKNVSLLLAEFFSNKSKRNSSNNNINPVHRVALQLSRKVSVLCLDEFQVTDIADAVLLSQLFHVLFHMGTVLVATSNRPPQDLYQGGLHREYVFAPLLDLLQRYCIVHSLQSETDYRLISANNKADIDHGNNDHNHAKQWSALMPANASFYFCIPKDDPCAAPKQLEQILHLIMKDHVLQPTTLSVGYNRSWTIQHTLPTVLALLDFETICQKETVGATEYRALAESHSTSGTDAPLFPIVVMTGIPRIDDLQHQHNQARRFITLIDELYYDGRSALLCTAEAPAQELFPVSRDAVGNVTNNTNDDKDNDILAIDQAVSSDGQTAVGALASVTELSFAFQRAASRLVEMTSYSWWEKCGALQHLEQQP